MKRFCALALCILMIFPLCACASSLATDGVATAEETVTAISFGELLAQEVGIAVKNSPFCFVKFAAISSGHLKKLSYLRLANAFVFFLPSSSR